MIKLAVSLLLFLVPGLVLADGSLSFAPPASDYSVVFLGNLFGVVDGVLSGSGSQIMGAMFGVLNAAVLALGGIVILYTLIVATMNTAHEGQMLGQKWSSIWIPIRSTIGLALLIPKASGYCMMQIFVMWVVVQGIGAADKVWDAALSYLNRGGVIIQAQQINPASQFTSNPGSGINGIATGAETILAGQVCMLGLQTQLENTRQTYLDQQSKNTGPCNSATSGSAMDTFCKTTVPDFLSTVNAVSVQTANPNPASQSWTVDMPNFDTTSPYYFLNGICGSISWESITKNPAFSSLSSYNLNGVNPNASSTPTNNSNNTNNTTIGKTTLSPSEVTLTLMSRAIAIQQMYSDLSGTARSIISNDPLMSTSNNNNNNKNTATDWASQQFGIPFTENGNACSSQQDKCVSWGPLPSTTGGTLFTGLELMNAINDYNGIMMPTINLARMINSGSDEQAATAFISKASSQGWLMAGAYFFNLITIQGSSTANAGQVDSNTGLNNSAFNSTWVTSPFKVTDPESGASTCTQGGGSSGKDFSTLCVWFNQNATAVTHLESLITTDTSKTGVPTPSQTLPLVSGDAASTIFGFLNNSLKMQTPGQPGAAPVTFAQIPNFNINPQPYKLQRQSFSCGGVKPFYSICIGRIIGDVVYNLIIVTIYNLFIDLFGGIIGIVIAAFLETPLKGLAEIFKAGLDIIAQPGVNPVIALANMGSQYINFAGNLWMYLLGLAVSSALIPIFGVFIFALLTLAMPLVIAWVGIMVSIGFVTSYYVPVLPYVIFVFGGLGWLMVVIEAMVAAPIVALGVTHPEGHDAFGKGEAAIMLLLNIFLRPAMMIIGYIAAIALTYVGVWILNAGFDQAIGFVQVIQKQSLNTLDAQSTVWKAVGGGGDYSDWSGVYAYFFSILIYTSLYLTIVQKSFTLITYLPDKVLRWIGGTPESIGQESAQWGEEVKGKVQEAGKETQSAQGSMEKTMGGIGMKAVGKVKGALGKAVGGGGDTSGEGIQDGGEAGSSGGSSTGAQNPGPSSSSVESTQHAGAPGGGGGSPPPISK
ncbi:type IVB secretion system protein DotA [Legionella sainthelensi]|uniref:type IVB secretion system protein DotA n=1 Tax=Legionella sainthelensi TaxID=28087 RepID=UPI000E20255D|nr:type IVB secretion system protein DotA [Legionella sainthelensi]